MRPGPRIPCAILLAGCAAGPGTETEEVEAALAALIAADNAGDLDAIADAYAADAVLLPPSGDVVRGREAIRARYAAGFARFRLQVELLSEETRAVGDLAFSRGRTAGRFVWRDGRVPTPFADRYLMVLEKGVGKGWQISALMWNPEPEEER